LTARNPDGASPSGRLREIDTLRGVAVFGILLVNIWAFAWGLTSLRYGTLPAASGFADRAAVFLVAWLAEQKFYPVFAFLFGAGFAIHTRSLRRALGDWTPALARYRRRLLWLLAAGIAHGVLVWSGDILSFYALCGLILLPLAQVRLSRLRTIWTAIAVFYGLTVLVNLLLFVFDRNPESGAWAATAFDQAKAIYSTGTWTEAAQRRVADFAETRMFGVVFFLPHTMLIFMLGIFSVRLGWLTRPRRHHALWRRTAMWGLLVGAPLNLAWGAVALYEALHPDQQLFNTGAWNVLLEFSGPCLAAGYIAVILMASPRIHAWLGEWLAPVGRMALSNYLMQSIAGTLVLQGWGGGLAATIDQAPLLMLALSLMPAQVLLSKWWLSRHPQGPAEALWRRLSA
jgi:uncharacterized protein